MLIAYGVGGPREPGAPRGTVGLQRLRAVLGRDRGEDEDADQRLAFGGALGKAERAAVRGVLDQSSNPVERRGTLRRF